jgi:hypothetical protein
MDKFTELIKKGVASFHHEPIISDQPQDPFARTWNNVFSIPSDTHCAKIGDEYIVTGHIISDPRRFGRFLCHWGGTEAIDYRPAFGCTDKYICPASYISSYGLEGHYDVRNGDNVYILKKRETKEPCCVNTCCPDQCCTSESRIPRPIHVLSVNNSDADVKDCWASANGNAEKLVESFNTNHRINGNAWFLFDNKLYGKVNENTYIVELS